jgi:3-methyladenine DNA glycosylase AlkC
VAKALKHFFDESIVRGIAHELARVYPKLPAPAFVDACMEKLSTLSLTGRAWHIADVMHGFLPTSYREAVSVLLDSLGDELQKPGGNTMAPFRYLPHVFYVQKYGLNDFEVSMRAQYELTQRFTAEWSIRAFLVRYPEETYARLLQWAGDDNMHVRRLVSEGTRPRLPWAPRLKEFQKNPKPVIQLLELLKDDPALYVRRSVANNLNDIGKDHPDRVVAVCRRWLAGAPPNRTWIVRHALRSLVKKAHPGALALLGVGARPKIRIDSIRTMPPHVRIGGALRFSLELVSAHTKPQELMIDYIVHFMKAKGTARPKVFKLRRVTLAPSTRMVFNGSVSFADMTTRRHYPGVHRMELLVNGVTYPGTTFVVSRRR